jgi:hypothetical protein
MALARTSLAIRRSDSVENRPNKIVCNIFGLILVVSTRVSTPNSRDLLTLCFASTVRRINTMSFCQMFRQLSGKDVPPSLTGNRISKKADGSLGAGYSKSSRDRKRLGDKSSLRIQICKITNIPHTALQGYPLSQFSIEERLR